RGAGWPEWAGKKVGQVGGAIEALFTASVAHSFGKSGDQIHNLHELAFDIGSHRIKFVDGPANKDREQIVVGRETKDHPLVPNIPLKPFRNYAAPVRQIQAHDRWRFLV